MCTVLKNRQETPTEKKKTCGYRFTIPLMYNGRRRSKKGECNKWDGEKKKHVLLHESYVVVYVMYEVALLGTSSKNRGNEKTASIYRVARCTKSTYTWYQNRENPATGLTDSNRPHPRFFSSSIPNLCGDYERANEFYKG